VSGNGSKKGTKRMTNKPYMPKLVPWQQEALDMVPETCKLLSDILRECDYEEANKRIVLEINHKFRDALEQTVWRLHEAMKIILLYENECKCKSGLMSCKLCFKAKDYMKKYDKSGVSPWNENFNYKYNPFDKDGVEKND